MELKKIIYIYIFLSLWELEQFKYSIQVRNEDNRYNFSIKTKLDETFEFENF